MAYSSNGSRRRSSQGSRSSKSRGSSGSNHTQGGDSAPRSRRGTLTRPDTGYRLHSRRVSRTDSHGGGLVATLMRPRVLLLVLIVVLVIAVLVVGISSCVRRNNDAQRQNTEETKPKNDQDSRVAAGISAAMTSKFTVALDRADLLAQIAKNADEYDDERMLTLALNEPEAIEFVAAYPSSDKSSRPYDTLVKRGEVPCLYNWDSHWGAVTYGNGPIAITGSGPTTLAMAYMGLTGKTDFSPTEIAQRASKSNYADGDSGSKGELFSKLGSSMGLDVTQYDPSSDTLLSLNENTVFAVELKPNTLTDDAHWALVVNVQPDGSVTVFDPSSSFVSSKSWDVGTITNSSTTYYALSASATTLEEVDGNKDKAENGGQNTTNGTTDSTSTTGSTGSNGTTGTNGTTATDGTTSQNGTNGTDGSTDATGTSEYTDGGYDEYGYSEYGTDEYGTDTYGY